MVTSVNLINAGGTKTFSYDNNGNITQGHGESIDYDAFSKPRLGNWTDKSPPIQGSAVTDRGFTAHEHLDDWKLIHINDRVYDYSLGRFLPIDPLIQSPDHSQSINPYSKNRIPLKTARSFCCIRPRFIVCRLLLLVWLTRLSM